MKNLIIKAIEARNKSYSPYSGYRVGAALECSNGEIVLGCNIENAAYTPTNCAERTAIFKAVSEGILEFKRIAIVGGKGEQTDFAYPCGVCRQVMAEFCDDEFEIIVAKSVDEYKVCTLREILPEKFGKSNLG